LISNTRAAAPRYSAVCDRWAPAVQGAIKPLAKSVQIVGGLGLRAAANTNRSAAPIASSRGARAAA
jgi:hypothetical protein